MILAQQAGESTDVGTGDRFSPQPASEVNVGGIERVVSMVAGATLAVAGLQRRTLPGAVAAVLGGALVYRGATGHCSAYEALGINSAQGGPAEPEEYFDRGIHVEESMTVNRTPWDLYQYWRNFENLAQFMKHVESVKVLDERRSHWVVRAPAGTTVEWDAEIINDEPNALIAWRSLADASVDNAGSVRFVPGPEGRGTTVKVVIDYIPPAGRLGKWVATLFGKNPESQIREDLRRFKQVMETGEVPTTEGQSRGSCA